jgi:ABC-type histidine transport system ATPase subunit
VRYDATNIIHCLFGIFGGPEEMNNCGKTMQMVTMDMGFTIFKTSKIMFTHNY